MLPWKMSDYTCRGVRFAFKAAHRIRIKAKLRGRAMASQMSVATEARFRENLGLAEAISTRSGVFRTRNPRKSRVFTLTIAREKLSRTP